MIGMVYLVGALCWVAGIMTVIVAKGIRDAWLWRRMRTRRMSLPRAQVRKLRVGRAALRILDGGRRDG
jgi:hypothetical protein